MSQLLSTALSSAMHMRWVRGLLRAGVGGVSGVGAVLPYPEFGVKVKSLPVRKSLPGDALHRRSGSENIMFSGSGGPSNRGSLMHFLFERTPGYAADVLRRRFLPALVPELRV